MTASPCFSLSAIEVPFIGTMITWTALFGATASAPVAKPRTVGGLSAFRDLAASFTRAVSWAVMGLPSERLTTISEEVSSCCGNAFSAISRAWTDSYFEGRKSPWSDSVVSLGEKAMMSTAATSQATMVHHGCLTTKRASRANMGASLDQLS